jgi:hypothetical protein
MSALKFAFISLALLGLVGCVVAAEGPRERGVVVVP